MSDSAAWPDLSVGAWAPTKKTLHAYSQMLGKLRVALSPTQPNWMFASLYLSAHGITTGPMPWRDLSLQGSLDVFSSELILELSDGRSRRIALLPARTVAEIYAGLLGALQALGIDITLNPIPQEVADVTPFDIDRRPAAYDPAAVARWFAAATTTAGIFDRWRAHFFGRNGIRLWWGAFDLALILFNGRHVPPPLDRGYLMKYDLDAALMNAGVYFGDEANAPFFYGYIYPQPDGAPELAIEPNSATWSDAMKEWILPYDAVRAANDPARDVGAFLDTIYAACSSLAGWDRAALSYVAPKRSR